MFWKKLDLKPARIKVEEIDVDAEWAKLKQQIDPTPPQVKKSYFEKIKQILNPGSNTRKPPVVQTNTRGRPTKKTQEQRMAEPDRKSSYTPSTEREFDFSADPPRNSSYAESHGQTKQQPLNVHPDFPNITLGPKTDVAISNYGWQIPKVFHPYILKIKDVRPDGHCGFRSVAVGLGQKQTKYLSIRQQLLKELRMNEGVWRHVFDPTNVGLYDALYNRIEFHGVGRAERENWMLMPDTGFLIAQRYGVIVHTIDSRGSDTIFPLLGGPDEAERPHQVVAVVFVDKGHFIHVQLKESYPMPPPNLLWTANRTESAAGWCDVYQNQINAYRTIMYPKTDVNDSPHVQHVKVRFEFK